MTNDDLFFNGLLACVLMSFLVIQPSMRPHQVIEVPARIWGFLIAIFVIICMASIPVDWNAGGVDRTRYANDVVSVSSPDAHFTYKGRETLFYLYIFICAQIVSYKTWFFLTALIYVGNYCIAACRLSKDYAYILILMMLCCFQFYSYGQNTIRAGLAGSFIILAVTYFQKPHLMALFAMIGYLIHGSMIVPIAAMICAYFYRNSKVYFYLWLLIIVVSYFWGSGFEKLFQGLTDDQRTGYLAVDAAKTRYKVGFRWDFLLYSSLPVMMGYFYIYKLRFESVFYHFVYNTYLVANSFWVLVIRANFTDRFAYLSWFLFPILLFYPLITQQLYRSVSEQRSKIFLVMCIEFGFTYFMYWMYK